MKGLDPCRGRVAVADASAKWDGGGGFAAEQVSSGAGESVVRGGHGDVITML